MYIYIYIYIYRPTSVMFLSPLDLEKDIIIWNYLIYLDPGSQEFTHVAQPTIYPNHMQTNVARHHLMAS